MKIITTYKCNYCGLETEKKSVCKNHEKICVNNPVIRTCQSCAFSDITKHTAIYDEDYVYYDTFCILLHGYYKEGIGQPRNCEFWRSKNGVVNEKDKCQKCDCIYGIGL